MSFIQQRKNENLPIKTIVLLFISTLIAILSIYGCKPIEILNATITRKGYSVYYDIAYGVNPRQKLDVYVPDKLSHPPTTIVYFYGGSWQSGDKDMYRFIGQTHLKLLAY